MKLKHILFTEIAPLVRLGSKRPLEAGDMPPLPAAFEPRESEEAFRRMPTERPYHFVWKSFWAAGFSARWAMITDVMRLPLAIAGPLLFRALLQHIAILESQPDAMTTTLLLALFLALTVIADGIVVQHFYYYALMTWARIANGLYLRIYRHALRLTRSAQMTTQTGDLVNHIASDSEGIGESSFFIPEIIYSALQVIATITLLFNFLGVAAISAIVTVVLMMPVTRMAARKFAKHDTDLWKHRDDRITLMSQILSGIRVIKYFAWERSIIKEVDEVRGKEIHAYVQLIISEAISTVLFLSTSTIVAFAGFGSYVLLGGTLSAEIIFPCLLLFMQLEQPVGALPHWIKNVAHARVAAERLHKYFQLAQHEETERTETEAHKALSVEVHHLRVEYPNATADTSQSKSPTADKTVALADINLHISAGESLAIVGAVGAGKSTLLLSILGEVEAEQGNIRFPELHEHQYPRIAYVPQEAYILNATVRENICFGEEGGDLESIITDTALSHDLAQMSAGLETEIGERGVNLSGGQKMRVALARAAAKNPGLVILDDPLAAVDVHTEAHLSEHLLFGRWNNITRIVSTHRLAHLAKFDRVIFLHEGRIEAQGSVQELLSNSKHFRDFYAEHLHAEEASHALTAAPLAAAQKTDSEGDGRLVDEEDRATGTIRTELFMQYIRALAGTNSKQAPWIYASLVFTCLLVVVLPILQNGWLGWWSDAMKRDVFAFEWMRSPFAAISVYGGIGVLILAANYLERVTWMLRATKAGRDIHNQSLRSVLAAPLRFFDSTPMGRVLNRFARDLQSVDDELAWNFESAMRSVALMMGTLVLVFSTAPIVMLFAFPALAVYYRVQRDYRRSAREAKRLESIARSPRYAHFKETIIGLPVVRSYRKQELFTEKFVEKIAHYQRMFWGSVMLNRWFSSRAPVVSGVIALATTITIVFLIKSGSMSAGLAGVVITYSLTFWGNLNWCVRAFSEVESRMTGFERLRQYALLEAEPDTTATPLLHESEEWLEQQNGSIEFNNVWAKYAENLPYVLKGVNFRIEGGMRVGIAGRTGSGKTTLFQSLFRFIEIAEGEIRINGINIACIPLGRLRRAMAVIPQDPTLFIGTIRSNLDRFSQYRDEEIWAALRRVKMDGTIVALGGLQAQISENGYNFSQGQRQLLCLARAILTQARIIVMDEATASVDVQTDALIQQTIRQEFAGVTVLIIAHRLNSIADADMIIEMGDGEVKNITLQQTSIAQDGSLVTERIEA